MKKIFPLSLTARTLLMMLVGLSFSHILSILIFSSEKLEPAVLTDEHHILERMATVVRLLGEIPPASHPALLAAMSHSGMHYQLVPPQLPEHLHNHETLQKQLAALVAPAQVMALSISEPDWHHDQGSMHRIIFSMEMAIIRLMHEAVLDHELHAWIALPYGQWVLLKTHPTENHAPLFRHATISVLVMTVAIFIISLIIVSHMTLPLRRIIRAADDFGHDVYAAPLPEEGAREIVTVARAFNRMNRRIRDFVEERLRMVAAISHDLRTPLTKLKLMTEFVGDESTRQRMSTTLDEMESMLTATLTFARETVQQESKQRVNLSSLLSSICEDMADMGLTVTCQEADKLPCHCRPLAMKRAFTNLIHNAVKYGGAAHVSLQPQGSRCLVTIHDPGQGIPPHEWENVFKPFLRLEPSRSPDTGGVGLGLSIAASVIRDHEGKIHFSHPAEGGFEVRVELPLGG
ncbi:MAG: HAMP domain-containing protein [Magnetococcales bacterium]|nr:HAMP domain-containing protein [Magnetococcales bacterium]NGZ27120.1 HAMP domain-containing protein [Magnetococcales bacterium]